MGRTEEIIDILDNTFGTKMICYLNHDTPWQLLIAVILSAQCTDKRVNIVTEDLFKKYATLEDFANADFEELRSDINSIGFANAKAKNIIACSQKLINNFNGIVPNNIDDLLTLDGVGRKTANVILGNVYNIPSIVVDTHVNRISNRLGFTTNSDPTKIEQDLMQVLPQDHWIIYNIQIITFGRTICLARNPKCDKCPLTKYCIQYQEKQ